ncbi:type II secretion system, protein F domain, partial [Pseudomonas amygdali pv. mori str. 301020]
QPLKDGMSRIERNVQLGVSLPDAARDFAELYERDEFHLFALGLRVNHRYGGNASELMENLIKLIRDREQAGRQLRAMTGETRMTALVLALLPVGMAGYFLTVHDIVEFARSQHILCQGRGSAANSAVCYALGITELNPEKSNLLFERFISKERNEPPDIDVDFEHDRREEVIQYIFRRY